MTREGRICLHTHSIVFIGWLTHTSSKMSAVMRVQWFTDNRLEYNTIILKEGVIYQDRRHVTKTSIVGLHVNLNVYGTQDHVLFWQHVMFGTFIFQCWFFQLFLRAWLSTQKSFNSYLKKKDWKFVFHEFIHFVGTVFSNSEFKCFWSVLSKKFSLACFFVCS